MELADILDTTTDKILNAGNLILRKNKKISIADVKEGFIALADMRHFFGADSPFYRGAIEGINIKLKIDIEEYLKSEKGRELLLAEAIVHYLVNGYTVDSEEINDAFSSENVRAKIQKYQADASLFRNKAKYYQAYRPPFPKQLVDFIFSYKEKPIIADIASGTGRLSALCVEKAEKLYAVEPNVHMRRIAEGNLTQYENYVSLAASAENIPLTDNSVDIITVASAYHYFDNENTKKEFRRILKPCGQVFLFWDVYNGNPYDKEKENIDQKYRAKKNRPYSGISPKERAEHLFGNQTFQSTSVETTVYQTFDEFFGGWSSASYTPDIESREYADFKNEAFTLFSKYATENGLMEMKVITLCFYGTL